MKNDKMIKKMDKDVWIKLRLISMEKELSVADTVKLLVLFYEKQKELFNDRM